jgi:hypothetical protein
VSAVPDHLIQDAILWWRLRIEHLVFALAPKDFPLDSAQIIIVEERGLQGGVTHLFWSGDLLEKAIIRIPADGNPFAIRKILRHELGHALGLAHDEDWTSIMHGMVTPYGNENLEVEDVDRITSAIIDTELPL